MKALKLTDETGNSLELSFEEIIGDDKDIPSAAFACSWDGMEAFFNVTDVADMSELIRWMENIKDKMVEFKKANP